MICIPPKITSYIVQQYYKNKEERLDSCGRAVIFVLSSEK